MRVVSQSYLNMYITEANRQTARLEYDLAEMRREAERLRAERDRLREALEAEQSARDAFQNEMVAREVFMDAGKDTYQASLDAWDEAKRRVEPTREIADKLRAEALKP